VQDSLDNNCESPSPNYDSEPSTVSEQVTAQERTTHREQSTLPDNTASSFPDYHSGSSCIDGHGEKEEPFLCDHNVSRDLNAIVASLASVSKAEAEMYHKLKAELSVRLEEMWDLKVMERAIEAIACHENHDSRDSDLLNGIMRAALRFTNSSSVVEFVAVMCQFASTDARMPQDLFVSVCMWLSECFVGLKMQDLSRLIWAFGNMEQIPEKSFANNLAKHLTVQLQNQSYAFDAGSLCNVCLALKRLDSFPLKNEIVTLIVNLFDRKHDSFDNKQLCDVLDAFHNMRSLVSISGLSKVAQGLSQRHMTAKQLSQILFSLHGLGCELKAVILPLVQSMLSAPALSSPTGLSHLSARDGCRLLFVLDECKQVSLVTKVFKVLCNSICSGIKEVETKDFSDFISVVMTSSLELPPAQVTELGKECFSRISNLKGRDFPALISVFSESTPDLLNALMNHLTEMKSSLNVDDVQRVISALYCLLGRSADIALKIAAVASSQLLRLTDKLNPMAFAKIMNGLGDLGFRPADNVMTMLANKGMVLISRLHLSALCQVVSSFSKLGWFECTDGEGVLRAVSKEVMRRAADLPSREAVQLFLELNPCFRSQGKGIPGRLIELILSKAMKEPFPSIANDLVGVIKSLAEHECSQLLFPNLQKILGFLSNQVLAALSGPSACSLLSILAVHGMNPLPNAIPAFVNQIRNTCRDLSSQNLCSVLKSLADLGADPSFEITIELVQLALKPLVYRSDVDWRRDWETGPRCGTVGEACDVFWSLAALHARLNSSGLRMVPVSSDQIRGIVRNILSSISSAFFAVYEDVSNGSGRVSSLDPLNRLYAFFTYLHISTDARESLVDCDANTFKLAGVCHATYISANNSSVAQHSDAAAEAKLFSEELGLSLEYGKALENCGYVPSLVNYELMLIMEIGEREHVILGPENRVTLRGDQNLKSRHLFALGWTVVFISLIEWQGLTQNEGGQPAGLVRKAFLSRRLFAFLPPFDVENCEVQLFHNSTTSRKEAVYMLERIFCLCNNLSRLTRSDLFDFLRITLSSEKHVTACDGSDRILERICQLLTQGGLEDRISNLALDLELQHLDQLTISVATLANVVGGQWQSKQLLSILAELYCKKLCRECMDAQLLTRGVMVCGALQCNIDVEFLKPLILILLRACTPEIVGRLEVQTVVMVYSVASKIFRGVESCSEAIALSSCLAERASCPDVLNALGGQDVVNMVQACNHLKLKNARLIRSLAERGHEILGGLSPSQLALLVHGLATLEMGLERILELLPQHVLSPAFLQSMVFEDMISLVWAYAAVDSGNVKFVRFLVERFLPGSELMLQYKESLHSSAVIDFLWALAVFDLVSQEQFEGRLWPFQVRMCQRLITDWEAGRFVFWGENTRNTAANQICPRRTGMLRQYVVAIRQGSRVQIHDLPTGFAQISDTLIKIGLRLDQRQDLAELRQDVLATLQSNGVEVDDAVALPDLGYVLGLKLRGQAITLEVFGRSDCFESLRDRQPQPNGIWILRLRQLRAAGFKVVMMSSHQWEGLLRAELPGSPAMWLQQLLAVSNWTVAVNTPEARSTGLSPGCSSEYTAGEMSAGEVDVLGNDSAGRPIAKRQREDDVVSPPAYQETAEQADLPSERKKKSKSAPNLEGTMLSCEDSGYGSASERGAGGVFDPGAMEEAVRQTKKRLKVTHPKFQAHRQQQNRALILTLDFVFKM
jgi:hypothetical protein